MWRPVSPAAPSSWRLPGRDRRLDAECLAAHALGVPRWQVILSPRRRLTPEEFGRYLALLGRRERREPLAYVLGMREFWSLSLSVSSGVLVARPETETLVQATLAVWSEDDGGGEPRARAASRDGEVASPTIVELCTGSGAVAIAWPRRSRRPHPGDGRLVEGPQSGARQCPGPRGRRPGRVPARESVAGGERPAPAARWISWWRTPIRPTRDVATLMPEVQWSRGSPWMGAPTAASPGDIIAAAPERIRPGGCLLLEIGARPGRGDPGAPRKDGPIRDRPDLPGPGGPPQGHRGAATGRLRMQNGPTDNSQPANDVIG